MGGISQHHLTGLGGVDKRRVDADRPCVSCGYNLRGLPLSGRCPECGTVIRREQNLDDSLARMPVQVIRKFSIAAIGAASSVVLALLSVWVIVFRPLPDWVGPSMLVVLAGLWIVSVMGLTPAMPVLQAMARGFKRGGILRIIARALQFGWLLAAGCVFTQQLFTTNATADQWLARGISIGSSVGIVGLVCLSIMLERLAEWTRDDTAEKFFNWCTWGLPITGALLILNPPIPFLWVLVWLGWVGLLLLFPISVVLLSRSITLSMYHAWEYRHVDIRRYEREQEYQQKISESIQGIDKATQEKHEREQRAHLDQLRAVHDASRARRSSQ